MAKRLINEVTGKVVQVGDDVVSFRGTKAKVTGWDEPRHAASTGRIYVKEENASCETSYFPGVFSTKFVECLSLE